MFFFLVILHFFLPRAARLVIWHRCWCYRQLARDRDRDIDRDGDRDGEMVMEKGIEI